MEYTDQQREIESGNSQQSKKIQKRINVEPKNPEEVAKYLKYNIIKKDPNVKYKPRSIDEVPSTVFYNESKKYFDKLYNIIVKYDIDQVKFLRFCVFERNIVDPRDILKGEIFAYYANYLKMNEQYKFIYEEYIKTANRIADYCIENNISAKEYVIKLIKENRLAYEYITGRISGHFIASIQDFRKIFFKLDNLNRDELSIIYESVEVMDQEVQESFLKFKNQRVKPILLTETIIKQKLNKLNKSNKLK